MWPCAGWLAARWVGPRKAKKEPWKTKPSDKTFRRKTYLPKACNFHVQMPGSLNWRTKHVIFMSKCLEVLTGGRSIPGKCLREVPVGCRMKHAKGLFKGPIRSHWCVASGWLLTAGWSMPRQRFKGFKVFKGLEGFKGLRAGKRQAWTPIRSHWCVALGCLLAAGWSMPRDCLSGP